MRQAAVRFGLSKRPSAIRRRLVFPRRVDRWFAHQLQRCLVKPAGGFVKHARYYWLLLAEGHPGCRIPRMLEPLSEFVGEFAEALNAADSQRPTAVSMSASAPLPHP